MNSDLNITENTEQILLDLLGVFSNITNNSYSEYEGKITGVDFYIQDGYEAVPLWYVRREVIQYESGDRLHVIFRPNLKAKRLKPDYLRTAP